MNDDTNNTKAIQDIEESSEIQYPSTINEIPLKIKQRAFVTFGFTSIISIAILLAHFIFPDFNYLQLLIASLILVVISAAKAAILIIGVMKFGYIELNGFITNIANERFDKSVKIVQIADEEKDVFISFKYSASTDISIGNPVTLFLSAIEPITVKGDLGNFVDSYLGVVFSIDDSASETNKTIQSIIKKSK